MSRGESSQELLFTSEETAPWDQTQQESSLSSDPEEKQETAVDQEEPESSASDQEEAVPNLEDQNGRVSHEFETSTSQKTPDDKQSDIVLVERAYLYLTKGAYPEGATKNEKRSIRWKAERLKEEMIWRVILQEVGWSRSEWINNY